MSAHNDIKLVRWLFLLLLLPLTLAYFSGDRFRYPCQDPSNWDKDFCKFPICDVRRECPEHIFKGQRDPRLGPPKDGQTQQPTQSFAPAVPACTAAPTQGANCGK
jgi:hypothetical protein